MTADDFALGLATVAVVTWFLIVVIEHPTRAPLRTAVLLVLACGMFAVSVNARFIEDDWITKVVASFNRGVAAFGGALLLARLLVAVWERRRHDRSS